MTLDHKALHKACTEGDLKMAESLLQSNADDNALHDLDDNPLAWVFNALEHRWITDVDNICYRMTRLLVSYGARLNTDAMYIMLMAVKSANLDTLKLLVNEANGDLNYRSTDKMSCLHSVILNNQPNVIKYVVAFFKRENINIDLRDKYNDTPLLRACRPITQNHNAVKILLQSGADLRIVDKRGLTSFDLLITCERDPELAWLHFNLGYDIHKEFNVICSLYPLVILERPWLQDISAELARKATMGRPIDGTNWESVIQYGNIKRYFDICIEQLIEMNKAKFYKDVSFWNILTEDKTKLTEYAGNSELVEAFFNIKCNGAFPIYCARVRHRFIGVISRHTLIDLSTSVVSEALKHPTMYEIIQHEVMTYMNDDDFLNILRCCNKP